MMVKFKVLLVNAHYLFIKKIYGDHNDAKSVKKALQSLIQRMPDSFTGLNIGAGNTRLHKNIKNLELEPGENIDYVGTVLQLPCKDEDFDLVIAQEVLEHVDNPQKAVSEIYRVLKTGGFFYLQLPFIIGFHPCPNDYWRFTHEGIRELIGHSNFRIDELKLSVGPAVGFYRILVEFFAIVCCLGVRPMYKPLKFVGALVFWPIKLFDPFLSKSPEANRIAGGYFVIGQKI